MLKPDNYLSNKATSKERGMFERVLSGIEEPELQIVEIEQETPEEIQRREDREAVIRRRVLEQLEDLPTTD